MSKTTFEELKGVLGNLKTALETQGAIMQKIMGRLESLEKGPKKPSGGYKPGAGSADTPDPDVEKTGGAKEADKFFDGAFRDAFTKSFQNIMITSLQGFKAEWIKTLGGGAVKDIAGYMKGLTIGEKGPAGAFPGMQENIKAQSEALGMAKVRVQELIQAYRVTEKTLSPLNIKLNELKEIYPSLSGVGQIFSKLQTKTGKGAELLKQKIAAMALIFKKAGVPAKDFNERLLTVSANMGKNSLSTKEVEAAMQTLANRTFSVANSLGTNLANAMDITAKKYAPLITLGNTYNSNIDRLASAAHIASVEMQSFINVSNQFDTIENAASTVGDLNAVLRGTNLSINEMVAADPADRVKAVFGEIQKAISEGRVHIAEGGQQRRFMIKTLADAARIDEVEMDRLLRNDMTVDEMFKNRIKTTKDGYGKIRDQAKENLTVQDRVQRAQTTAGNQMAIQGENFKKYMTGLDAVIGPATEKMAAFGRSMSATAASITAILEGRKAYMLEGGDKGQGLLGQLFFGSEGSTTAQIESLNQGMKELLKESNKLSEKLKEAVKNQNELRKQNKEETKPKPGEGDQSSLILKGKVNKGKQVVELRAEIDIKELQGAMGVPA